MNRLTNHAFKSYFYSGSHLMRSHFNVPLTKDYQVKLIGYCYHSVM